LNNIGFKPANILLPNDGVDMTKWAVVACDQFTSEPKYWQEVEQLVGDAPSTLKITLPEAYLEGDSVQNRIESINGTMQAYLDNKLFNELKDSFIYVERTQRNGVIRHGLVGVVDLEMYNYNKGSQSLIRATEGTVLERIPPRVRVRENAALELPHIMLLIDDEQKTVIEPLAAKKGSFKKCYDVRLMQQSGSIKGYRVDEENTQRIADALLQLSEKQTFEKKYHVQDKSVLLFAVGDGNHSLATAKECFERLKKTMPQAEWQNHTSRFALVEVVNVHDEALTFEPIHRVLFDINPQQMITELKKFYDIYFEEVKEQNAQSFEYITSNGKQRVWVRNPSSNIAAGTLQNFIDYYVKQFGGKVDYIHGEDVVEDLGTLPSNAGFLLSAMNKSDLFKTVILDGVLPRKTFSMGHAWDKRFYLECRRLKV
jgi:uncharacterized protein (DUF1015 family)